MLELGFLDIFLQVFLEEIVVKLIGAGELCAIDLIKALERIPGVLMTFPERLETIVAPAIVPSPVAQR